MSLDRIAYLLHRDGGSPVLSKSLNCAKPISFDLKGGEQRGLVIYESDGSVVIDPLSTGLIFVAKQAGGDGCTVFLREENFEPFTDPKTGKQGWRICIDGTSEPVMDWLLCNDGDLRLKGEIAFECNGKKAKTSDISITFSDCIGLPSDVTPTPIDPLDPIADALQEQIDECKDAIAELETEVDGLSDTFATVSGSVITFPNGDTIDVRDPDTFATYAGTTITFADGQTVDLGSFDTDTDTFATLAGSTITFPNGDTFTAVDADEVVNVTAGDVGTAAPADAQWGFDPATGETFYVDAAGNWQPAGAPVVPDTAGKIEIDLDPGVDQQDIAAELAAMTAAGQFWVGAPWIVGAASSGNVGGVSMDGTVAHWQGNTPLADPAGTYKLCLSWVALN